MMKFNKLSIFTVAVLAMAGTAYAATPFQGFYANLGVGGINTNFNVSQTLSLVPLNYPPVGTQPFNQNNSDYDVIGSLGVGYTFLINPSFVLGAELNADIENAKTSNSNSTVVNIPESGGAGANLNNTTTNELKNNFAFLIKPGFVMDQGNTMVYGIIGPRWGNFETSTSSSFQLQGVDENGAIAGNASNSHSGYEPGLVLGAGIQKYIANNLSIGVEYQYTNYGHISTASSSGGIYLPSGEKVATINNTINSIKVQTNVLSVNLMYHF